MTTPSDRPQPPASPPGEGAGRARASIGTGNGWRRQHPAAVLFNTFRTVRAFIFPIIAGVLVVPGLGLVIFLTMVLSVSIGFGVLRYWRYRYRFGEHELAVEQGWLYRQVRHIAYVRIQNVNITRNPLHRLFGVSGLQLESASGSEAEAVMEAVSPATIEELHERVDRAKAESEAGGGEPEVEGQRSAVTPGGFDREQRREILRIGVGELVRHGLISNRGMVLVAAVLGYLFQGPLGDRFFPWLAGRIAHYTERPPAEILDAMGTETWFLVGVAVFVMVLLFLGLLSVIYAIIRYYGFTLSVDSRSVRAEYGLFTRVAITIPKRRIQLIGFRQNPFHRLCRRVAVKVETAGLTGGEENPSSLRWLAPILPVGDAPRILREVQPELSWEAFEWHPLHPRTRARMLRIRLIWLLILTAALAVVFGMSALLVLLLAPLIWFYARGYARYSGWALAPAGIAFRSGWVAKQQSVVRFPKIQVVSLSRNPFDRRWGMGTVSIDTAGSDPTGHRVHIRFMDQEKARRLSLELEEKIRQTEFAWG